MRDTHWSVVVVGGGQAGLSMSWHLQRLGIDHVVLEAKRAGGDWRERRWDSFCLVTPNWQCRLPGFPYQGTDPDGFMVRDEIVGYLDEYVRSHRFPLREHTRVTRARRERNGTFRITTVAEREFTAAGERGFTTAGQPDQRELTADQVVVATGPYQAPLTPRMAERIPSDIVQLHSARYRNPGQLPAGEVLVIGTGQSGCQIAEDLHLAGRKVHLAVGSAPRVARFYRGRDVVAWLDDMGYYRRPIAEFADADAVRFRVNHYVTGRNGGHDIDLRAFAKEGMQLYGRLSAVTTAGTLTFDGTLKQSLDAADAVSESIKDSIDGYIEAAGMHAPDESRYTPVWEPPEVPPGHEHEAATTIGLREAGITGIVWATGFGTDHRWIEVPVFDGRGYPTHQRGVTSCPGLYFLGLPWQHTWGSGRFAGVSDDAGYLARRIAAFGGRSEVTWIAGTPASTFPGNDDHAGLRADDWTAPRTVA